MKTRQTQRCALCTILIGEGHIYQEPVRVKVGDRFYNVDEDCFHFIKKLSKPTVKRRLKKTSDKRYSY